MNTHARDVRASSAVSMSCSRFHFIRAPP
jgi:hypothetical protein